MEDGWEDKLAFSFELSEGNVTYGWHAGWLVVESEKTYIIKLKSEIYAAIICAWTK
jgi:hypothetical protein